MSSSPRATDAVAPDRREAVHDEAREDAQRVADALLALGPLDREALFLLLQGRSLPDIATGTRTTTAMVRVRLHRAVTAVQRAAGPGPAAWTALADRPADEVLTDAELGITPALHARLVAAVALTRPPAPPRFRRLDQLRQSVGDHRTQLAAAGPVVGLLAAGIGIVVSAS